MKEIIILCFLGDPCIPAVSCDRAGGFNVDSFELIEIVKKMNMPVSIFTNTSEFFKKTSEVISPKISLYRIDFNDVDLNNQEELDKLYPKAISGIRKILDEKQITPSFIHSLYWFSGMIGNELAMEYNTLFIHSAVDLAIDKINAGFQYKCRVQYMYEKKFLEKASLILSITESEKRKLVEFYNINSKRIIVTGRNVDACYKIPDHDVYGYSPVLSTNVHNFEKYLASVNLWWNKGAFTYFGRLKRVKGLIQIIQAWCRLYKKYYEMTPPLWIIGGSAEEIADFRNIVIKYVPDLETIENLYKLCWWGYLSSQSISAVLLKTMVVVTASQYEAGGRVIIESMSMGKPVIATPVGFAKDMIRSWHNGFLVSYEDSYSIEKTMEYFIRQPFLSSTLGMSAKDTFDLFEHSWQYNEKITTIYKNLWNNQYLELNLPILPNVDELNELITDYFDKEIIKSFPYAVPNENEVMSFISKELSVTQGSISFSKELSIHSMKYDIAIDKKRYIAIVFYSRLNKACIADAEIKPQVINSDNIYNKILSLKKNKNICKITAACHTCRCIIMPKYNIVYNLNKDNIREIINAVAAFCFSDISEKSDLSMKSTYIPDGVSFTLAGLYEYLNQIQYTAPDDFKNFFSGNIKLFRVHAMNEAQHMCISYGKSFINHIIYENGSYLLLPTYSYHTAENGYDAAVLIIDFIDCNENIEERVLHGIIEYAAKRFEISENKLIGWCFIIICIRIRYYAVLEKKKCGKLFIIWNKISKLYK